MFWPAARIAAELEPQVLPHWPKSVQIYIAVGASFWNREVHVFENLFLKFSFCSFALLFITYLRYRKWSKRAKGKVSDKKIWIFSGFGRFQKKSKGLLWPRLFRAAAFAPWGHRAPVERLMPPMARAKKRPVVLELGQLEGRLQSPRLTGAGEPTVGSARARARSTKSKMLRTK